MVRNVRNAEALNFIDPVETEIYPQYYDFI